MKRGFTLVEMMISIAIFSMIALFLYKTYANLNHQNVMFRDSAQEMKYWNKLKKVFYLDFTLNLDNNITIIHQDSKIDTVIFQTSNSIHDRINPYIAYFVKDNILYRMESFSKLSYQELPNAIGSIDNLGKVETFQLYKGLKKEKSSTIKHLYLLHVKFENKEILYKLIGRNQY
ncbi:MAG: prepilin-type N-terminal cleavage/methylation domain-containing protein [Epsilonproteobacteria bacterium]|nr:prepilin-type N-terminal cleavage/methylation domain-containing protein [Campylobacterota bacterium]